MRIGDEPRRAGRRRASCKGLAESARRAGTSPAPTSSTRQHLIRATGTGERHVHPAGACRGRACPGPRQTWGNLQDGRGRAPPLRTRRDNTSSAPPGPENDMSILPGLVGAGLVPARVRPGESARRAGTSPAPTNSTRQHLIRATGTGERHVHPAGACRGRACPGPRQTWGICKTGGDEPRPYELDATTPHPRHRDRRTTCPSCRGL